jgi:hypothetical protein
MDVIVHLPRGDEDKPMREFARVLRPGGFLALRASALDILRSHHSQFAMERQRFTRGRLVKLAEDCGFRVQRCTYANSLLMPVALLKFRVIEPLFGGEPQSGVQPVAPWLDRLLYGPLKAESKLLPAGVNLPLGQSLILLAERMSRRAAGVGVRREGAGFLYGWAGLVCCGTGSLNGSSGPLDPVAREGEVDPQMDRARVKTGDHGRVLLELGAVVGVVAACFVVDDPADAAGDKRTVETAGADLAGGDGAQLPFADRLFVRGQDPAAAVAARG